MPFLADNWRILAGALVACLACFLLGQCDGRRTQAAADKLAIERAQTAALRINAAATEIATAQRARDVVTIAIQKQDRDNAIEQAVPSPIGNATSALGCRRLRAAGLDRDAYAAGCGR